MQPVRMALVGCGGIAGAHVKALEELWQVGVRLFDVVAVCDVVEERARERAAEVGAFQGTAPAVYTKIEQMLGQVSELEAADICTLHSEHHGLACQCLEAGLDVHIEKPLAITLRAGQLIIDTAVRQQRVLAVGENYRRSPAERATRWALEKGRIGKPRTFFWQDVGEGLGKWGWRNFKHVAGGGWMLDGGVHFADLFRYHLGAEALEVRALTRQFEPFRYDDPENRRGAWRVDVEDLATALISFPDEVVVQWTWSGSAPGQGFNKRVLYGSEGCLDWDSGLWLRDGTHIEREVLVQEFTDSLGDEEREHLFPGGTTNPIAIELKDFADAVRLGVVPEVDGVDGFRSQAVCMALFESAWSGQPVSMVDIERCLVEDYQRPINQALGLEG
ncbi:MAG: hypothetical protein GKR89_07095 [Candidatus Latescibacteria bacterium]|nr:hypothetical protein [Candidatus Latescibacterota bacterium]